jgi:hypothetical protein
MLFRHPDDRFDFEFRFSGIPVVNAPRSAVGLRLRDTEARPRPREAGRLGVVFNGRAHRNRGAGSVPTGLPRNVSWAWPHSLEELSDALCGFADDGVDLLAIDGGDGTVRDVLSLAHRCFPAGLPRIALIPSGKSNALAKDLGIPRRWTVADVQRAAAGPRREWRTPIEIARKGMSGLLRGFLFGAGGFVRGTALAQTAHRCGIFGSLAVGMGLASVVWRTVFGGADSPLREGERMAMVLDDSKIVRLPSYLVLTTALERLPLGLKPFGRERGGMKLLVVEAPPRRLLTTLPRLLSGSESAKLALNGYHRWDPTTVQLAPSSFILDGELFEGGPLSIRRGAPVEFIVP